MADGILKLCDGGCEVFWLKGLSFCLRLICFFSCFEHAPCRLEKGVSHVVVSRLTQTLVRAEECIRKIARGRGPVF